MNNEDRYSDIFDEPIDPQFTRQIRQIETLYNTIEPPTRLSWTHFQLQMRQQNVLPPQALQPPRTHVGLWVRWIRRALANVTSGVYSARDRELRAGGKQRDGKEESISAAYAGVIVSEKRLPTHIIRTRNPWFRFLEQGLAALLVLGIIVGWLAVSHLPHSSNGLAAAFNDASAPSLGAPAFTFQGTFGSSGEWLSDNHTLITLQVDTQKNQLEALVLNVASGHSTLYPVLDSSWVSAFNLFNIEQVGQYLIALRSQGKNLATMEIWDVIGQRAITTQTVPARIGANGQVLSTWISASDNQQKFALLTSDGEVTIWDIASGQKLITCAGKVLSGQEAIPRIQWYDHDQDVLLTVLGPGVNSPTVAYNVLTGRRLFSLNSPGQQYSGLSISPDSKYLALYTGPQSSADVQDRPDKLEILDAHSGQVLRTYPLDVSGAQGEVSSWLPDSEHQASIDISSANAQTQKMQVRVWDIFSNQTTLNLSFFHTGTSWNYQLTPDGQYLLVGDSDGSSMEIWQTSNGHRVATVTTPGVYDQPDAFFYINNQQMIIGQRGNFDIWDIATGTLLYKYHGTTPFSMPGVSGSEVFWSPDGKYLTMIAGKTASIGDGTLSIWRLPR